MEVSQGGQRVFVSHQCGGSGLYFISLFVISSWQQANKGLAPPSPSLATDTKRLATDKQSVWQQIFFFFIGSISLYDWRSGNLLSSQGPIPLTWTWLSLFKSLKKNFNNALVSHPPIHSLMSTWPMNTSLKLKWLLFLSPLLQLEHMALTLQNPLLNFNMGVRHNPLSHCRYVDGYGCPWHAAYHGKSEAVANFGHWYSPPFSWSVWQVTTNKQDYISPGAPAPN